MHVDRRALRFFWFKAVRRIFGYGILGNMSRIDAWMWGVGLGSDSKILGRVHFHRVAGGEISFGRGCRFRSGPLLNPVGLEKPCYFGVYSPGASLKVGDNCGFSGTAIAAKQDIRLGNNILCGANVTITDSDWHPLQGEGRATGQPCRSGSVLIGDDVFLGMGSTVLKGSIIGANSVIAARSVVAGNIPSGVIAGGIPARVLRPVETLPVIETSIQATNPAEVDVNHVGD